MKVCNEIIEYLIKNDVKNIFGVPTATISPMVNAMEDYNEIKYKIVKNEAAATFSAAKYAKVSQKLGVCMISGSVGLLNSLNGIAEAAQSKSPMLIITGYVDRHQQGKGAIQELEGHKFLDNSKIKYNKVINNSKDVINELKNAIEIAMAHPRGPVHIGLPRDIQRSDYEGESIGLPILSDIKSDYDSLNNIINEINNSENGLIIVGGGCRGLSKEIKQLSEKLNWRLVTTTSAKGIIEEDFKLHMGHFGFSSTDLSTEYVNNAKLDCILALGTQLGENATNNFDQSIIKNRKLLRIDIDNNAKGKSYKEHIFATADLNIVLEYLINNLKYNQVDRTIKTQINEPYDNNHTHTSLRRLYETITDILPKNTFYMNDIGESQQFAFKYLRVPTESDFECNINYGCMGSTIGCLGINGINPDRPIAVFTGDGSFYMNGMAELLTAKKYNMKIIYFVINNSCLSFVNRGHDILFGRTISDFRDEQIDISKATEALGIPSIKIENTEEINKIKDFTKNVNGPVVVEVITDGSESMPLGRLKLLKK